MADLSFARNELDDFKSVANESIHFKLVRHQEDIDNGKFDFEPDMSHQIFGDSEMIFGYKDLNVKLYYTAAQLIPFLDMTYTEMVDGKAHGVPPDDVMKAIRGSVEFPPCLATNLDSFKKAIEDDSNFKPFGTKIDDYTITTKAGDKRNFDVYNTKIDEPGFREYHERLQTFIKFFIDAASYIDADDEGWDFYLLFERYKTNDVERYAFAGYVTVYNFYAYPCSVRPRISQVLVLPPFQKMGLAAKLIQTFYNTCYSRPEVLDITVEDPSDNFQRIREFVDATNCSKLDTFRPEKLHKGFTQYMVSEARNKLRINKLQSRRVYEILRMKATDESNKAMYRSFRLDIKRRLNIPFMKNRRTFQRLEKTVDPEELRQTLGFMQTKQKHEFLEKAFQEEVEKYRIVICRMNFLNV